nr:m7GpppN-mRNA hydrolase [Ciona intestinalis]|eukprot:XP_002130621.1 m7GpppN-mRNA hydrolase [Ciona intestinalis]
MSKLKISPNVLDDLCSRFLLNIPSQEKEDMIRLCFQIELAHWFYLDFFRAENNRLPDCRMKEFAKLVFETYPFLLNPSDVNVDKVLESWKEYKRSVPTYGAILMDSTLEYVLLVQGFWIKASWGFPKGKVNKDEQPEICAAREVLEETGYDITKSIKPNQYAEHLLNEQLSRLYFVRDVPLDTKFGPKTRGEIKNVQWFSVSDLPAHKKDQTPKQNLNIAANCFFMVIPFMKQLRRWIAGQKSLEPEAPITKPKQILQPRPKGERKSQGKEKGRNSNQSPRSHYNGFGSPVKFSTSPSLSMAPKTSNEKSFEDEQINSFKQGNNKALEDIYAIRTLNIKQENRNKPHQGGRGRGQYLHATNQGDGGLFVGKGKSLQADSLPAAWVNFTFDRTSLERAIVNFHNRNKY